MLSSTVRSISMQKHLLPMLNNSADCVKSSRRVKGPACFSVIVGHKVLTMQLCSFVCMILAVFLQIENCRAAIAIEGTS